MYGMNNHVIEGRVHTTDWLMYLLMRSMGDGCVSLRLISPAMFLLTGSHFKDCETKSNSSRPCDFCPWTSHVKGNKFIQQLVDHTLRCHVDKLKHKTEVSDLFFVMMDWWLLCLASLNGYILVKNISIKANALILAMLAWAGLVASSSTLLHYFILFSWLTIHFHSLFTPSFYRNNQSLLPRTPLLPQTLRTRLPFGRRSNPQGNVFPLTSRWKRCAHLRFQR